MRTYSNSNAQQLRSTNRNQSFDLIRTEVIGPRNDMHLANKKKNSFSDLRIYINADSARVRRVGNHSGRFDSVQAAHKELVLG